MPKIEHTESVAQPAPLERSELEPLVLPDSLPPSGTFSLSEHRYAFNLDKLEQLISEGRIKEVPGFLTFAGCSVFGFDLSSGAIIEGGTTYDEVEVKLFESFGEDYSLRYTIVEFSDTGALR